jgi:hemerythrin superfamily protein
MQGRRAFLLSPFGRTARKMEARMEMDPIENRSSSGFPVDDPMQALEKDHDFVKQLFEEFLNTDDMPVRQQAGPRILMLLEMHSALEEATFYPVVQSLDEDLVDECEEQHAQADQLIQQLKGMEVSDPQYEQLLQQLCDAVLQHIDIEENQLFPVVRQSNLDLEAMGLEMQAYEANMVATQAQLSERKDMDRR